LETGNKRGAIDNESTERSDPSMSPPGLKPPNLAKYDFNPKRVADLLKEYGAMLPSKDVYCTPDPKVVNFLKMMKDYLEQCHRELNYFEAKRCKQKIALLSQIEYARQMRRMEESQNQELMYVEQI